MPGYVGSWPKFGDCVEFLCCCTYDLEQQNQTRNTFNVGHFSMRFSQSIEYPEMLVHLLTYFFKSFKNWGAEGEIFIRLGCSLAIAAAWCSACPGNDKVPLYRCSSSATFYFI